MTAVDGPILALLQGHKLRLRIVQRVRHAGAQVFE